MVDTIVLVKKKDVCVPPARAWELRDLNRFITGWLELAHDDEKPYTVVFMVVLGTYSLEVRDLVIE